MVTYLVRCHCFPGSTTPSRDCRPPCTLVRLFLRLALPLSFLTELQKATQFAHRIKATFSLPSLGTKVVSVKVDVGPTLHGQEWALEKTASGALTISRNTIHRCRLANGDIESVDLQVWRIARWDYLGTESEEDTVDKAFHHVSPKLIGHVFTSGGAAAFVPRASRLVWWGLWCAGIRCRFSCRLVHLDVGSFAGERVRQGRLRAVRWTGARGDSEPVVLAVHPLSLGIVLVAVRLASRQRCFVVLVSASVPVGCHTFGTFPELSHVGESRFDTTGLGRSGEGTNGSIVV